jgi:hypothetical protein
MLTIKAVFPIKFSFFGIQARQFRRFKGLHEESGLHRLKQRVL